MRIAKIQKSNISGTVQVPPSKSAAHRALICSFLAGGSNVSPLIDSKDMQATLGVISALKGDKPVADCIESGSTLRFMIPVAAALGNAVFDATGLRLRTVPFTPERVKAALERQGT